MSSQTTDNDVAAVPVAGDISAKIAAYLAAAQELAAADAAGELCDELAAADAAALHQAEAVVMAVKLSRLEVVDRTGAWRADGAKASWSWLRQTTLMSEADARGHERLRKQLASLPAVSAALAGGRVSHAHAKVLGWALTTLGEHTIGTVWHTPAWLDAQERAFLNLALLTDPGMLRTQLSERLRALAPLPAAKGDVERRERRRVSVTPGFDEMWDVEGSLDPDSGQIIAAAVNAFRRADHAEGDTRTQAQRAADALAGICRFYLDHDGAQQVRGVSAHLVITVPEARMAAWQTHKNVVTGRPLSCCELGLQSGLPCTHPPGESARFPDPQTEPLFTNSGRTLAPFTRTPALDAVAVPPATWTNGQAVPESVLARYLCGADLTRIVLDAQSQPLDVGRTRRRHTHAMWLAACHQWQQQRPTTGCYAPVYLLEMHHPIPWCEGGQTSLANSLPLCGRCHTRVHDGHTLTLRDDRRLGPHGYLEPVVPPQRPAQPDQSEQPGRPAPTPQRARPRSTTLRGPVSLQTGWTCPARDHYGPIRHGVASLRH